MARNIRKTKLLSFGLITSLLVCLTAGYNYVFADEKTDNDDFSKATATDAGVISEEVNDLYLEDGSSRYILPIFETSDVHGHLMELSEDGIEYRLAFVADKIKDKRGHDDAYRKEKALVLDGGDIFQGYTASNLTEGNALSAAYKYMDYDAVTIGNHEFDWGLEKVLDDDKTLRDFDLGSYKGVNDIPVTSSNLYKDGSRLSYSHDYLIINKVATDRYGNEIPVRIGVIGFADNFASSVTYDKFGSLGYEAKMDFSIVNNLAKELEDSGKCDATIMLYHGPAKDGANSLGAGTAVDLVMGGHTHISQNNVTDFGLEYIQPGCNVQYYAYAEFSFEVVDGKVHFIDTTYKRYYSVRQDVNKLYDLPENADELDRDIIDISNAAYDEVKDEMTEEIGYITEPILRYEFIDNSGERATTAGNWVGSIIQRAGKADVAIMNKGGLRRDINFTKDRFTVTGGHLYEMFPFEDDNIYLYEITYGDLYDILQYSLLREGKGLLSYLVGINCYFTDTNINAIETLDGNVIYVDGEWKGDWKNQKLTLSCPEFVATTDRNSEAGSRNPFIEYNKTDRLISNDIGVTESAFEVLRNESAENDGFLYVDTKPCYINETKEDPHYYLDSDGVLTIEPEIKEIPAGKFDIYNSQKKVVFLGTAKQWYDLPIADRWLIENTDVKIVCSDKTIIAASYMCVNFGEHTWSEPEYLWTSDNSSVTASHTCISCGEVESETVNTTSDVTKVPTETETGLRTYTAVFENVLFEKQIKTDIIPALGPNVDPTTEITTEVTTEQKENSTTSKNVVNVNNKTSPVTGDDTPFTVFILLMIISITVSMIITGRNKYRP